MKSLENYRPANLEFEVNTNEVPLNLGNFKTDKEAIEFINSKLTALGQKITALRFIDNFEKSEIRKEYNDLLENKLPFLKKDLQKAEMELKEAKDKVKELQSQVDGTITEAESLAVQVKIGTKEINLDDNFTWRVAYNGKYFYYTFIDNQIKLAKIAIIPDYEKSELFNQQENNAAFFNSANDIYQKYLSGEISAYDFAKKDLGIDSEILKNE
jgi:hypothetical protein